MTKQEFLDRAHEMHGYKYEYLNLKDKILSNDTIEILYNNVLYKQKVVKHILLGRCPEKNTPLKTSEEFIKEAKIKWGNKYDYSLTNYKGALKKIKIKYEGIVFEQIANSHLNYAPELNMNQEYFIHKAKKIWKDEFDYSLVEYKNCKEKVKIIFNKTNEMFEQSPESHLICHPEGLNRVNSTKKFILESNIIHDNKFIYDKSNYINTKTKIIITCPIHGDFSQIPNSHLQGNGCSLCNESKGEKKINKFLTENNIVFERQKKFEDCKNIFCLPFDFYIPSLRICIEFDGIQHYKALSYFGGEEAFKKTKINDNIKNDYCENNYIDLIRIRYEQIEDIEYILSKSLSSLKMFL
jgi:hypothetical protein